MSWFFKVLGSDGVNSAKVYSNGALAVTDQTPNIGAYCISEQSGTIAAALAANSSVFAMRIDPGAGTIKAIIDTIRVQVNTIAAFSTPVTAGRRLAIFRGSGASASAQTAITIATPKDTVYPASEFDTAAGGDIRIAATGALTVTGITFESAPIVVMPLTQVGSAGNFVEYLYEFTVRSHPVELNAGQLLAIRNPVAMDAGGTWILTVTVNWHEAVGD